MMWGTCISIAIKEAGSEWNLTSAEEGLMGTCHTLGIFTGAYIWGRLCDIYGRLKILQTTSLLSAFFGIFYVFSVNYYMILIAIVLEGFCNGGTLVSPGTLYSETTPFTKSWTLVLLSVCIVFGGIISYTIALFLSLGNDGNISIWRWVGGVVLVIQVIYWVISLLIFESPKFLIKIHKEKFAINILE